MSETSPLHDVTQTTEPKTFRHHLSPRSSCPVPVEHFLYSPTLFLQWLPRRYESCLMPAENKPLEMCVLKRVKELLAEVDARTAAQHITMADCRVRKRAHTPSRRSHKDANVTPAHTELSSQVARILGVTSEAQRMMGVSSGLELLTLPHGHQLRLDLLERYGHALS